MKFLGALFLSVLAVSGLVACGGDDDTGSSTSSTSSTSSGGTSTSSSTSGAATSALTGTCATLKDCCPKVKDMSSQTGCNFALANCANNQGVCTDTLKNYADCK